MERLVLLSVRSTAWLDWYVVGVWLVLLWWFCRFGFTTTNLVGLEAYELTSVDNANVSNILIFRMEDNTRVGRVLWRIVILWSVTVDCQKRCSSSQTFMCQRIFSRFLSYINIHVWVSESTQNVNISITNERSIPSILSLKRFVARKLYVFRSDYIYISYSVLL